MWVEQDIQIVVRYILDIISLNQVIWAKIYSVYISLDHPSWTRIYPGYISLDHLSWTRIYQPGPSQLGQDISRIYQPGPSQLDQDIFRIYQPGPSQLDQDISRINQPGPSQLDQDISQPDSATPMSVGWSHFQGSQVSWEYLTESCDFAPIRTFCTDPSLYTYILPWLATLCYKTLVYCLEKWSAMSNQENLQQNTCPEAI